MAKKKAAKVIGKKKIWVELIAPALFNSQPIGESYVYESSQVLGKSVSVNMSYLTGNHKKQSIAIVLKVVGIREGKGITEITGYKIAPSSARRMMRRSKSKIDDSFVCVTADGMKVRVKPIVVSRSGANNPVMTAMRAALRNTVSSAALKSSYQNFMADIVSYKIQKDMFDTAKKIFPVAVCEIRWAFITPDSAKGMKAEVPAAAEASAPESAAGEQEVQAEEETPAEEVPSEAPAEEAEKPKKKAKKKAKEQKAEEVEENAEADSGQE